MLSMLGEMTIGDWATIATIVAGIPAFFCMVGYPKKVWLWLFGRTSSPTLSQSAPSGAVASGAHPTPLSTVDVAIAGAGGVAVGDLAHHAAEANTASIDVTMALHDAVMSGVANLPETAAVVSEAVPIAVDPDALDIVLNALSHLHDLSGG